MKKILILFIACLLTSSAIAASLNADVNASAKNPIIDLFQGEPFEGVRLSDMGTPSNYQLSVIHFILQHTEEVNIHQMRGESDNTVYLKKDGHSEAVFDKSGKLVTNYNAGSYNYYSYKENPIKHFSYDILPWLAWGSTRDDPTSYKERLFAYSLDLNRGIQHYIFNDSEALPRIAYASLSQHEQAVYKFFSYLLFNKNYNVKLDVTTKNKFKDSGKAYYAYFYQIQNLLAVKSKSNSDCSK